MHFTIHSFQSNKYLMLLTSCCFVFFLEMIPTECLFKNINNIQSSLHQCVVLLLSFYYSHTSLVGTFLFCSVHFFLLPGKFTGSTRNQKQSSYCFGCTVKPSLQTENPEGKMYCMYTNIIYVLKYLLVIFLVIHKL